MACHLFALENLAREFAHTNGTRRSVSLGDTVGRVLHREVPPFNRALEAFTLTCCTNVDELSNLEVTRPQAVSNRQEALLGDWELGQMPLWRKIVLQEMADLGFLHLVWQYFANADLNGVNAIFLLCFDLCDLASVDLNDGAWLDLAPLVPEVGAADLVANNAGSL